MSGEWLFFTILAIASLSGALMLILLDRVVQMLLATAFTFISIAGLYVLLHAEFIAVAQLLIYAGAVTVMMLFGIMLTRHQIHDRPHPVRFRVMTGAGVVLFLGLLMYVISNSTWTVSPGHLITGNTAEIGQQLFAKYVIPFELTSIVLLVALVGAIILAKKDDDGSPQDVHRDDALTRHVPEEGEN